METEGFQTLIRDARDGDRDALERLLASVREYLRTVANGFDDPSRASRSASDLVQEAELRVWQHLDTFQGAATDEDTHRMFRTWLSQIVRRLAYDLQRRRTSRKRTPPDEDGDLRERDTGDATASTKLMARERAERIGEAIDALPEAKDREIIRGFFFEGRTLKEMSSLLDLPYHIVRERYRAAMDALDRGLRDV